MHASDDIEPVIKGREEADARMIIQDTYRAILYKTPIELYIDPLAQSVRGPTVMHTARAEWKCRDTQRGRIL